ncbi:reverse transcriptase domain-containing protein [Tanacetum coccineum]
MFKTLREINMKLNPKKCAFGMREGTFLGYKVNAGGLRVCPDKVEAVLNLPSPKCLKDVQKLKGKLASLNRFLSKSAKKSLPFFKTLKKCTKKSYFQWTVEAEIAFKQMKKSIAKLPMLTAPKEKEELIMYLASAKEAISAVLMTERDGKQMSIYFVSRALQGPKINYTPMKKLILALTRMSVKGQILADFIMERPEDDSTDTPMEDNEELPDPYFDATNNEAGYEALIAGLRIAKQMGVKNLQANVDSRLVANQYFQGILFKQVPRGENKKEDALSKMASTSFSYLSKQVLVDKLKEKSIYEREVLAVVKEKGRTWMTPIYEYLTEEILPEEKIKARAIRRKAGRSAMTNGILYKRFGLPGEIISNNGKQFRDNPFKDWCENLCIRQCFAFVKHPQANDLVERANRSLGEGIKARLDERSKNWLEEISHVLWAYRTMIKSSNKETPFSLTYETKAVIPLEIGMPTLRTVKVDMIKNDEAL